MQFHASRCFCCVWSDLFLRAIAQHAHLSVALSTQPLGVIGAYNALLNWSVHKIDALSLETADARYSFWLLSGCHCSWVSLLLAFVTFWFQSIGAQIPAVLIYVCCCIQPLQAHAGVEHQIVPPILSRTLNLKCFYISLVWKDFPQECCVLQELA
jgi:hypothetical protein